MESLDRPALVARYLTAHTVPARRGGASRLTPRRPFVTLSRQAGAGAHLVGTHLVDLLNADDPDAPWSLFDQELLRVVLEMHDLPRELARYMPEDRVHTVRSDLETILGLHPAPDTLIRRTNEAITAIAGIGHAVIVGRGGNVLTRAVPGGVHVRLVAEEATRRARIAGREELTATAATARLRQLDDARRAYLRDCFGADVDDPLGYDLVLNTTRREPGDAAAVIAALVRGRHAAG